jgi:hypothetical protein
MNSTISQDLQSGFFNNFSTKTKKHALPQCKNSQPLEIDNKFYGFKRGTRNQRRCLSYIENCRISYFMDYWLNPILSLFLEIEELCTEIHFRLNKSIFCTFNFVSIGLVRVAEEVGLNLLAPRKKITVILIGNHSAGKSSFINW